KAYNNVYDSIWKDMARKDAPKVSRIMSSSLNIKQLNAKKTAQLASKEARRWQIRANRSVKEVQVKARRGMKEMMTYWKRNEKSERDKRKKAERESIDRAKKEEEEREARRQARKLNFLISQTELYSHFIGNKIQNNGATDIGEKAAVGDVDFDNTDDNDLEELARKNAQSAVKAAQDRAKQFSENKDTGDVDMSDGELNFQNPTTLGEIEIKQPKMLRCQLKEYQIKGLNWLVNLYEQGINGILADEMGLGKTVQSMSVMAYLAETHNIWGPFLVIAPASTLHNWQQEISRFIPDFRVLPYWGNTKDRKILRKFWDRKRLTYDKNSDFHVLVTSYQLVVADAQYFQRVKWQYMILDEAQAIKSSSSARWKSLLGFHCRNRLLLTGTPIQNSMQELWALLHFIMPTLFDSHDEFSDWFSRDIESHAQSNTQLNEQQLRRLHMILKPFMLRRVKKNVQSELGDKIEIDVYCNLTHRQRAMYDLLKRQVSVVDLLRKAVSGGDDGSQTLMNLVMQFRKVCNHPDLFERSDTKSPLSLAGFAETGSFLRENNLLIVPYSATNLIKLQLPRLFYTDGGKLDIPSNNNPRAGFEKKYTQNLMSIWASDNLHESRKSNIDGNMSFLGLIGYSEAEISATALGNISIPEQLKNIIKDVGKMDLYSRGNIVYDEDSESTPVPVSRMLQIVPANSTKVLASTTHEGVLDDMCNVWRSSLHDQDKLHRLEPMGDPRATAPPIAIECHSSVAAREYSDMLFNQSFRESLFKDLRPWTPKELVENKVERMYWPIPGEILPQPTSERAGYSPIRVPSMAKFVAESGKLSRLDQLLVELKQNDHRVLIYFQMTKMMDMMEEYLTYRQYRYVRLDGSSKLGDRRDLVHAWQTQPELFVFLLSTRAGGLGINLTAADTVIFYDSDWNPTIDSQAMDRAHRLGQTKQVTVYRLLVKGTIEERMRDRAKQKMHVQEVVMEGKTNTDETNGAAKGDDVGTESAFLESSSFQKPGRDVAFWLLDDDAQAEAMLKDTKLNGTPDRKVGKRKRENIEAELENMYHEGEGFFESEQQSEVATPVPYSA
ncbi:hypothetical protein CANCADRAFT_19857, partial [Tortispora caseinolytica NRRL Y-17796]